MILLHQKQLRFIRKSPFTLAMCSINAHIFDQNLIHYTKYIKHFDLLLTMNKFHDIKSKNISKLLGPQSSVLRDALVNHWYRRYILKCGRCSNYSVLPIQQHYHTLQCFLPNLGIWSIGEINGEMSVVNEICTVTTFDISELRSSGVLHESRGWYQYDNFP